jgi:hypothetical protein
MICRHCRVKKVCRPRGLCWHCFHTPGVREQYHSTSKFAHRGVGIGCRRVALLPEPTDARPDTPEKVAVMEERALRGLALFHPKDATDRGEQECAA